MGVLYSQGVPLNHCSKNFEHSKVLGQPVVNVFNFARPQLSGYYVVGMPKCCFPGL